MEDFVTYEIAVKLKEKGFKEECFAYYLPKRFDLCFNKNQFRGGIIADCLYSNNSLPNECIASDFIDAPTIYQVLKWLREAKWIHIDIAIWKSKYIAMIVFIDKPDQNIEHYHETIWEDERLFDTYEEAAIAGIEYVLNNLI